MARDSRRQTYASEAIEVTFEPKLCIHAARCVLGLPGVFRPAERPWIRLEEGEVEAVAEVVRTCPTGALQYRRLDGGAEEVPDSPPRVEARRNGPLFLRGDIEIRDAVGGVVAHVTRAALCRCGGSGNKPFCDNTHKSNGFQAD